MIQDCSKVKSEYQRRKGLTLDINEHLGMLRTLSSSVPHVTEFGVREGHSTVALAAGMPMYFHSYDIVQPDQAFIDMIAACVPNYQFHLGNTLEVDIEPTSLLLIDSYHTYNHLKQELDRHSDKVERYIVLHDTETFGLVGQDGSKPGLMAAVDEFVAKGKFKVTVHYPNNNGLTVLERIQ